MKCKLSILFTLFLCIESIFSQGEITVDGHWMQGQLLNPASMKTSVNDDHLDFTFGGRRQWLDFPGSPKTYLFDGAYYAYRMHTKIGLQAVSDQVGFTCEKKLYLIYAYNLPVGEERYLRMGFSAGFYTFNHDLSLVESDVLEDPAIKFANDKDIIPDFNLGVEYVAPNIEMGATVHHLQRYFDKNYQYATNYAYAKYRYEGYNFFNILSGLSASLWNRQIQVEGHLSFLFKNANSEETWWLGGTYRTPSEWNANVGVKITPSISVNYTYGYHFGQIRKNSIGTHEILINYSIDLQNALCPTCRK